MEEDTFHYDFTTASELEVFIARLEEIIQDWGLHQKSFEGPLQKDDFKTNEWCCSCEAITFSEAQFLLMRYYLKCDKAAEQNDGDCIEEAEETPAQAIQDMISMENDFFPISHPPSKDSHPIARWYGLRDFLVLIPQHSSYVASESRVKILVSSVSVASSNTKCQVPFFVQAMEPWQSYFIGVFQSGSFRTEFNMVHLKRPPQHCKFLTGLLQMFKTKIGLGMMLNPVTVSVQITYVLKDWTGSTWTQEPPDLDFLGGEVLGVSELGSLPFGSTFDSISELYLSALWPSLLENSVVDGENYSDLDPMQAPIWKVNVSTVENPSCLLTDYFTEFVSLTKEKYSFRGLLWHLSRGKSTAKSSDISSSLNALTESRISAFSKAVIGGDKTAKKDGGEMQQGEGPISSENLMNLLYYLFPDADANSKSPYSKHLVGKPSSELTEEKNCAGIDRRLSGMKSAPFDGLLWRLSIVMSHVICSLGGVSSAAFMWYEFTQELRFRWENGVLIPGLEFVFPDSSTCLLNQKLQLLNCCIWRRLEREKQASEKQDEDSDSDPEEQFFDCTDDVEGDEEEDSRRRKVKIAPWDKPVGRLTKHGDLRLLENGEPLYIPVTQEPVPKTEDQLEEDAEFLLKLGTDAQGSEMRAKIMSASLLSDMEAFKAANPGCVLPDFIRWYSPRDWIEDEGVNEYGQRNGHLSNRMEIPNNTWLETWQVAQPVPAKWQRRLFNDTKEAEKVLDFLEKKTPKEFIELLLPVMIVCVIQKLLESTAIDDWPGVSEILSKLIKKAEILGRMPHINGNRYEELITEISAVETVFVHANSLKHKFMRQEEGKEDKNRSCHSDLINFIKNLLSDSETEVPGGPKSEIGTMIRHHFSEALKAERLVVDQSSQQTNDKWNSMSPFPSPHQTEMIFRLSTVKGPQRLHAVVKKNECRLCGAFTKNIYLPL